jgi:hypothetical protein
MGFPVLKHFSFDNLRILLRKSGIFGFNWSISVFWGYNRENSIKIVCTWGIRGTMRVLPTKIDFSFCVRTFAALVFSFGVLFSTSSPAGNSCTTVTGFSSCLPTGTCGAAAPFTNFAGMPGDGTALSCPIGQDCCYTQTCDDIYCASQGYGPAAGCVDIESGASCNPLTQHQTCGGTPCCGSITDACCCTMPTPAPTAAPSTPIPTAAPCISNGIQCNSCEAPLLPSILDNCANCCSGAFSISAVPESSTCVGSTWFAETCIAAAFTPVPTTAPVGTAVPTPLPTPVTVPAGGWPVCPNLAYACLATATPFPVCTCDPAVAATTCYYTAYSDTCGGVPTHPFSCSGINITLPACIPPATPVPTPPLGTPVPTPTPTPTPAPTPSCISDGTQCQRGQSCVGPGCGASTCFQHQCDIGQLACGAVSFTNCCSLTGVNGSDFETVGSEHIDNFQSFCGSCIPAGGFCTGGPCCTGLTCDPVAHTCD